MDRTAPAHLLTWLIGGLCALACALGPGIAVASATDGGSPAPVAPVAAPVTPTTAPEPSSPADSTAAVVTQQTAAAVAQAVQQAPVNIAIPTRVLSPGDDGAITQQNVVTAGAQAVNVTGTQQAQPDAPESVAAQATQPAGTQQSAAAVSQSTQVAPANIYIPVSILSPGDRGPVTQVNVATAQADATNVAQTVGHAVTGVAGQSADAGAGAAQQAPSNVAAPVTIGGANVGDHSPSQPWVWSWTWELDCSAGAPPPIAQLGSVIAQITGGAWQWDWTWTCAPAAGAGHAGPAASGNQPGTAQSTPVVAAQGPQQRAPGGAQSQAGSPSVTARPPRHSGGRPSHRHAHRGPAAPGTGGVSAGSTEATAARFLPLAGGEITGAAAISPARAATNDRGGRAGGAGAALHTGRAPSAPPAPTAPTVFSAGAAGGSGPGPLSVGLAALIGAFALYVPGFGTRARTQSVHRSPQAVPERKHRPG